MVSFLRFLINGISLGSVYAIIALGYTMVYGIAKMLNFAHGDVIMVGAYIAFCAMTYLGLPPFVAVLCAMVVCTVLGVLIEGLAYRPLREATKLAVLITAIGVSYLLQNTALLIWTANPKVFPSVFNVGAIRLFDGNLVITSEIILTIVANIVIMIVLTLFTGRTKMGKAMRAVSEDRGAAELMGINVNRTISVTFAIGSALAAIAGVLLLLLSHADAHHRLHAGHQGVHGGGIRRHRLHPRCDDRRPAVGRYRDPGKGLHFHRAWRRHRVRRADHRAAVQARRPAGQAGARESVRCGI